MLSQYKIRATIPAKDLARAKKFYTETLGFKPIEEDAEGVIFVSGGVEFGIYPTRASGGSATVAGWEVPDVQAEMKDLRNRGVKFEDYDLPGIKTNDGLAEIGGFKGAWFKDSEDNILALEETRR
jgi:catechol 2,3-dioxygenase-like lactoylglutathione lyase family enzyme